MRRSGKVPGGGRLERALDLKRSERSVVQKRWLSKGNHGRFFAKRVFVWGKKDHWSQGKYGERIWMKVSPKRIWRFLYENVQWVLSTPLTSLFSLKGWDVLDLPGLPTCSCEQETKGAGEHDSPVLSQPPEKRWSCSNLFGQCKHVVTSGVDRRWLLSRLHVCIYLYKENQEKLWSLGLIDLLSLSQGCIKVVHLTPWTKSKGP